MQTFDFEFINSADELLNRLVNMESDFPDLLLLDLSMPGIMGLQALREIRANKKYQSDSHCYSNHFHLKYRP